MAANSGVCSCCWSSDVYGRLARRRQTRFFKDGVLRSGDLDERCVDSLAAMKQDMAESVVAKFTEVHPWLQPLR